MAFGAKIQSTQKDAGSVSSTTLAFSGSNIAGNILAAVIRVGSTSETITSVTDSAGNSWNVKATQVQTSDGHKLHFYLAFNAIAGANTLTIVKSSTGTLRFVIAEYTAGSASDTTDQITTAQANNTSSFSAGNVTTTSANELLLVGVTASGGAQSTMVAGTGYTVDEQVLTATNFRVGIESKVVSSIGTYAGDATMAINPLDIAAAIITLTDGGGGGGGGRTTKNTRSWGLGMNLGMDRWMPQ